MKYKIKKRYLDIDSESSSIVSRVLGKDSAVLLFINLNLSQIIAFEKRYSVTYGLIKQILSELYNDINNNNNNVKIKLL